MSHKKTGTSQRLKKLGFILAVMAAVSWMFGYSSPSFFASTAGERETFSMMAGLFCFMSLFCFGGAKVTTNILNN